MGLTSILHSLAWVLFQNVAEAFPGQSPSASLGTGTVSSGSIYAHCQNFSNYDRAFEILLRQNILEEVPFPPEMAMYSLEREFIVYRLQLNEDDLKQHLAIATVHEDTTETELIGSFLDLARKLGRSWPTEGLAPIPVGIGPATYPRYFTPVVLELAKLGYCLNSETRMAWLPKFRPIMVAEGIWEGSRFKADVWREQVYNLISLMPLQLRARVLTAKEGVNTALLHSAFRHHWDPADGWSEYPRGEPLESRFHPFSIEQLAEIAGDV